MSTPERRIEQFVLAAREGDLDLIKKFVEGGVDIDGKDDFGRSGTIVNIL